jgi:hypothetical protein
MASARAALSPILESSRKSLEITVAARGVNVPVEAPQAKPG